MASNYTVWIYLGKRDKDGIKLVSQFKGKKILATRIKNLSEINMPADYYDVIQGIIYENRFLYEPWIESADDFASLRQTLKLRGYTNIPVANVQLYGSMSSISAPEINTNNIPQAATMIRKIN